MRPALALLLVALPLTAADVDLKPVYLQTTPHQVILDKKGKAWFADESGVRDADNKLLCKPATGIPLGFDAGGRLWWRPYYEDGLTHFDGKEWHPTKLNGSFHADADGRVMVYGSPDGWKQGAKIGLHVFDADKWTTELLAAPTVAIGRNRAERTFRTHLDGRTWFWFEGFDQWGLKEPAAWSFDGKKWTAHTLTGRQEGESVDHILPLADDWFMVVVSHPDKESKYNYRAFAWSPTKTADEPLVVGGYRGSAGGLHHFGGGVVVTAKREARQATAEEDKEMQAVEQGPAAVYGTKDKPAPVFPFPVYRFPGDVTGPDADGRYYLKNRGPSFNQLRTWVLSPKDVKAEQYIQPTLYPKVADRPAVFAELFTDAAGTGFGRPKDRPDAVQVWDGKAEKWADTPIKPLPLLAWDVNYGMHVLPPQPPELVWGNLREVGHTCGTDGRTLFVRVKTKYAADKEGIKVPSRPKFGGGGGVREEADRRWIDPNAPFYQYEAWLHAGGGWSDPLPPLDLIKKRRKDLLAGFDVPATPFGPLPLVAMNNRLWFVHDWKVWTVDRDGTTHSVELPKPEVKDAGPREVATPPLLRAAFARADGNTLVLLVPGAKQTAAYRVKFRAGKLAGISLGDLDPLPFAAAGLHATPDGTVLAWQAGGVHRLADAKWELVPDTGWVLGVAPDGGVWCQHPDPRNKDADGKKGWAVLLRVGGAKAERFAWAPDEVAVGYDKPTKDGFAFPHDLGLACLEPTKPGAKPALRVRYAEHRDRGPGPLTWTGGHLLLADGFAAWAGNK